MPEHRIGTQEEWQTARDELLAEEKEHTRRRDELARRRRELPWVPLEKDYELETADGAKSLSDLFEGHSQLLIYHFMFGPSYEAGCPTCSSMVDGVDGLLPHLHARDVAMLLVSRAPLESSRPTSAEWVGASPGPHPRTATSTSTSAPPSTRSRCAR